jgi:hypothetical protein
MSDQSAAPAGEQAKPPHHDDSRAGGNSLFPVAHAWKVAALMTIIMVLLALLGVAITTASRPLGPIYWISLVPIYGVLCIATAWARERHAGAVERRPQVMRQVFHWLGIGIALAIDFIIRGAGEESGLGAGLNALLLLALGCYLAGVHLEWLFVIVGALLTVTLIILMKADEYIWLIFVVGGLAVLALFGLPKLFERRHRKRLAATPSH